MTAKEIDALYKATLKLKNGESLNEFEKSILKRYCKNSDKFIH